MQSEAQAAKEFPSPSLSSPKANGDVGSGKGSEKESQVNDHTKALDALERDFREVGLFSVSSVSLPPSSHILPARPFLIMQRFRCLQHSRLEVRDPDLPYRLGIK